MKNSNSKKTVKRKDGVNKKLTDKVRSQLIA